MNNFKLIFVWVVKAFLLTSILFSCSLFDNNDQAKGKFHNIVSLKYVESFVEIPMPKDKMIIDSRPYRTKFVNGHIPSSISLPASKFDKELEKLPSDKNARLIFYCGGVKCNLSHKSAWKAQELGYKNVSVFSEGFPAWKNGNNYISISLKWLFKELKNNNVTIVDSRPRRSKFNKGHIPGALSIPYTNYSKYKKLLPKNKMRRIVFYCGGLKCSLSHKSAMKAKADGYKNVYVFSSGYPAWKKFKKNKSFKISAGQEEGSIDHKSFIKALKDNPEKLYLIDVREQIEFKRGSLTGAINIPIEKLEKKIHTLPRDKTIIFFCNTGAQSGEAFYMVQDIDPDRKNSVYVDGTFEFEKDGIFKLTKVE